MEANAHTLGIEKLSVAERILLVEEIWDSIAAEPDSLGVPDWHKQELDRRLAAGPGALGAGSDWQEVKARLQKKAGPAP